jgi:hypothetical protein
MLGNLFLASQKPTAVIRTPSTATTIPVRLISFEGASVGRIAGLDVGVSEVLEVT